MNQILASIFNTYDFFVRLPAILDIKIPLTMACTLVLQRIMFYNFACKNRNNRGARNPE